ncbi:hypothetical protein M2318_005303 [Metapseudomonas resinovorans]|uniref:hypothetical protein n=1 Tax=Metapseudomonas resinovorans TaxID=53412 RepID=UPI003D2122B2
MVDQPKWREKRDRDSKVIPGCWVTDTGYTVALCRLPDHRYTITRPGGAAPFAYTGKRGDIVPLIQADMQASGVPA